MSQTDLATRAEHFLAGLEEMAVERAVPLKDGRVDFDIDRARRIRVEYGGEFGYTVRTYASGQAEDLPVSREMLKHILLRHLESEDAIQSAPRRYGS